MSQKIDELLKVRSGDPMKESPALLRFKSGMVSEDQRQWICDAFWDIVLIQSDGIVTMDYQNMLYSAFPEDVKPLSFFGEDDSRLVLLSERIVEFVNFYTLEAANAIEMMEAVDDRMLLYAH